MELLFELTKVFICILDTWLIFDFFNAFFSLRKWLSDKYIAAILGITAFIVWLINCMDSSVINLGSMQIIYLSLLMLGFRGRLLKKIFCYLVATAIMIGSELLWVIFLSLPSDFSMNQIKEKVHFTILSMLAIKLIVFILFNFAKRISKEAESEITGRNLLVYSIVPLSTLGIMICMAYLNINFSSLNKLHYLLFICIFLVVLGNILIFHIFEKYARSSRQLRQQELHLTRLRLEKKRYEQLELINREQAGFLHDIRHYMKVIGELIAGEEIGKVREILEGLQVKVSESQRVHYCHNHLLNAILSEKSREAEEKGIDFTIRVEPAFTLDNLENMDMITIMGNLLDNALEAAQVCKNGYIKLCLFTQNEGYFSVIKVVNNYQGEIRFKGEKIISGKGDKKKHGYGLENVRMAAEKYSGNLQLFNEKGVFTVVLVLPKLYIK